MVNRRSGRSAGFICSLRDIIKRVCASCVVDEVVLYEEVVERVRWERFDEEMLLLEWGADHAIQRTQTKKIDEFAFFLEKSGTNARLVFVAINKVFLPYTAHFHNNPANVLLDLFHSRGKLGIL